MMLISAPHGALEVRAQDGGVRITGRFPYGRETELARGRFERIEARAFAARIDAGEDVHFLAGHDFAKPLASRASGSLEIRESDDALEIEASVDTGTSWAADFLAAHKAGLIRGLSPGFRVLGGGERVERRGDGVLRRIERADLFEISAVTVPAYGDAQLSARCWQPEAESEIRTRVHPLARWRL
jgi:HK97 family phage prohead protease